MKKIYLLFAVIIFFLCSFNAAFCEGKLEDRDAYETYIGKTVPDVTDTISGIYELEDGWYLADQARDQDGKQKVILFHTDETGLIDKTAFVCERTISDLSTISVFDGLRAAIYVGSDYLGLGGGVDVMRELMKAPQTDENSYSISFEFADITCEAEPGLMTDLIPAFGGFPVDPHEVYNVICHPNNAGDKPGTDESWVYEILADNTARITGYTGNLEEIIVPASLDGHPVSSISKEYGYSWPSSLKSVVLPEGLAAVEGSTFMSCVTLKQVVFPSSLQHIGELAFFGCNALAQIDLPEGLVSVDNSAFASCPALETISLPSTLTEVGDDIFSQCSQLKFISVSSKNPLLSIKSNSLYKQDELIIYPGGMPFSAYEVEDGTSVIGSYAFYGNNALTSVSLPESIAEIKDGAFQNCSKLTSFTVPNGVVSIGKNVFADCNNLKSLFLPESLEEIDNMLFGYGGASDDLVITAESGSYAFQWAEERGYDVSPVPSGEPEEIPEPTDEPELPVMAEPEPTEEPKPPVMAEPEPTEEPELPVMAEPEPTEEPEPPVMAEPEAGGPAPLKAGDFFTFGMYEQDEEPGPDPIEWQVLAVENGQALVISRYGLDAKKYNDENTDVTWETCTLRAWLNGEFFNIAFNPEERANIIEVTNTNPNSLKWETNGGNDTRDRVFLLNQEEAERYFDDNSARACEQTYQAQQKGSNGFWWLRSAGYQSSAAMIVFADGSIFDFGDSVDTETYDVRPALWLDLTGLNERPAGGSAEDDRDPADNSIVVVQSDMLRDAPVYSAAVIRSVMSGTTVEKLADRMVDGVAWVQVRIPQGNIGWIPAKAFEQK